MKVTKRQKISSELHRLGLKGRLLETVHQHLDDSSARILKQQLNQALDAKNRDLVEYWIESDPPR
jgi:hypothetical protein